MALTDSEQQIVDTVHTFVERRVRPHVRELDQENRYPTEQIEEMMELGMFGLLVPEDFGGVGVSLSCFATVTEELSRGWMSLAGAMGSHSVVAYLLHEFGTPLQQRHYLPRMATGEIRAAMALTEPGGGSDLQAMRTHALPEGDVYRVTGTKTWISNARRAGLIALLCKTDPTAKPPHRGISILLVKPDHGYSVGEDLGKLGYRGVEACEISFGNVEVPRDALLGQTEGEGYAQMMRGLEVGRIQVAARAVGVAQAAFDDAVAYAQQRVAFGKPIWRHQSVANYLAEMLTQLRAARLLTIDAAEICDRGERADLEAGTAKLFASEAAMEIALNAMRIHGGNGYSTDFDVERYFRDAPLMILGEGTNEIQRLVISRQLIRRAERGVITR